ncbi:DUF1549 domain-containing protein [bacterium]|nr:DUF1549 domain-containing protein [bacterium]
MKRVLAPLLVVLGVFALCFAAVRPPQGLGTGPAELVVADGELSGSVSAVDAFLEAQWRDAGVTSAGQADELLVLRRLALSLMGTVPSLEEVRQFEADEAPDRLARWTIGYLQDDRFADYFAERLARSYVGVGGGQFIVFRRDRFVSWLSDQLKQNTPYDQIVREMVASEGLWTGAPASNFITSAVANGNLDHNRLAARSARAFLGQSVDCAQCHDHPFNANLKQADFAGLAGQFGRVEVAALGVHEMSMSGPPMNEQKKKPDNDSESEEAAEPVPDPVVPYGKDWLPGDGSIREQFAAWLTHPDNRRFERAITNRVWGLMFSRPYISPVDDLPDPPPADQPDLLDILGDDFRAHGYDLRHLIQTIAASKAFQLDSTHLSEDADELTALEETWAVFPLTRLRPEQVIGSMIQATWVQTVDQNSHLIVRFMRFTRENGFLNEYGDLGDQELIEQTGTIPQALLRMNSDMTRDSIKSDMMAATNRIAGMCRDDQSIVDTAYLVCVCRKPTPPEREHFLAQLASASKNEKARVVEDIFWALFNSPEFSWNH